MKSSTLFLRATFSTSILSALGLGVWQWLKTHRDWLPAPDTPQGKELLGEYLGTAYDSFLILLIIAIGFLAYQVLRFKNIERNRKQSQNHYLGTRLISFIAANRLVSIILCAYTVALIQEATWYHGELMGWIKDAFESSFLNNFSIRYDFVYETMRREDYRLFPLSHQDLHIYTWFTPYVKVMMIGSAAQLIAIVITAKKLAQKLSHQASPPTLLLASTVLILFSASIANAFFQLDYPGRMLTFLLAMYSLTYLHYFKTREQSSFYLTLLIALLGIFWKDTGFILFVIPSFAMLSFNLLKNSGKTNLKKAIFNTRNNWQICYYHYKLEFWLCWLFTAFCFCYIFLALIPSTYLDSDSYGSSTTKIFNPNLRFWLLLTIASGRVILISLKRIPSNFLDALNISALLYALALYILVGFKDYSYQYAPIEFITVVNILVLFCGLSALLNKKTKTRIAFTGLSIAGSALLVGYEHLDDRTSFYGHVSRVHELHNSWEETYSQIDLLTRKLKEEGQEVNIIYTSQSWFDRSRHLDRFRYDRLVEWDVKRKQFIIQDGINEQSLYSPKSGDIYINIDRTDHILPTTNGLKYNKIYQFKHKTTNLVNGQIYSILRTK